MEYNITEKYAKVVDNTIVKYPYTLSDFKNDNPNTFLVLPIQEETLEKFGMVRVQAVEKPEANYNQKVVETQPILSNGVWLQQWTVETLSQEELAALTEETARQLRLRRNNILKDCDWTQGKDISDGVSASWALYRQALRDIPQQPGFPFEVVFPEKP
jgi:hypothetical protein